MLGFADPGIAPIGYTILSPQPSRIIIFQGYENSIQRHHLPSRIFCEMQMPRFRLPSLIQGVDPRSSSTCKTSRISLPFSAP